MINCNRKKIYKQVQNHFNTNSILNFHFTLITKEFSISNPHFMHQIIHIRVHFLHENLVLVEEFAIFLKECCLLIKVYISFGDFPFWREIHCQHVYEVKTLLIVNEIQDSQVAAKKMPGFDKHSFRSLTIFVFSHNGSQNSCKFQQSGAIQFLLMNFTKSLHQSGQNVISFFGVLHQYLCDFYRIINSFAQEISSVKIYAQIFDDWKDISDCVAFVNEIGQLFHLYSIFLNNIGMQIAFLCHENFIKFNADFQKN